MTTNKDEGSLNDPTRTLHNNVVGRNSPHNPKQQKQQQQQQQQTDHLHDRSEAGDTSLELVRYLSDRRGWEGYKDNDELFVQELPKVELHVHLDGSFDPDFLWKYMQDNPASVHCLPVETPTPWEPGQTLPVRKLVQECQSSAEYHKLCTCRGYRSLKAMLSCFEMFLPLVRRNLHLLEQLAYDFCQRQWEQNIVYTEVRYSPQLLAEGFESTKDNNNETSTGDQDSDHNDKIDNNKNNKINGASVYDAVTAGLRRGCEKFGITVNQILCGITWKPSWAAATLDLALQHRDDYPCATVGIDIAASELHFDYERHPDLYRPHYDMIQRAKDAAFPITLHAGEDLVDRAAENVRCAVTEYGASRIGHGYRMIHSPDLMKQVKERNVHVEVCPTSSDETGGWIYDTTRGKKNWLDHPCITMKQHGVPFSLNSDDPAVFHTSLAWQYRIALCKMKLSYEDLLQCTLHAVDAAFCSPQEKDRIRNLVQCFAALKGLKATTRSVGQPQRVTESMKRTLRQAHSDNFTDRVHLS